MPYYYASSGTATTPAIALFAGGAAPPSGTTVTVLWADNITSTTTTDSVQVRFSPDGATWGSWQSVTNGQAISSPEAYVQAQIALSSTDQNRTPQMNHLRFVVTPPASWDGAQWQ